MHSKSSMRFALPACSAAVLLAVCSFAGAEAATISSSISTGPIDTATGNGGANIGVPAFDSSLGTLTEVTVSLSGSYTETIIPGPPPSTPLFDVNAYDAQFIAEDGATRTTTGTANFSGSGSVSDSGDLALYTSPHSPVISFSVSYPGPDFLTSTGFSGTLTYTYTPAVVTAATPEPSSLMLLGTGVLGAAGALRRRVRV